MKERIQETFVELINQIAGIKSVRAIGISGNMKPFPEPGKGDYDIFIYCDNIPDDQTRNACLKSLEKAIENIKMSIFCNEAWGLSDYCTIEGIDTWLMFFFINMM